MGFKKSLSLSHTHTHIYAENFILASMYRSVMCGRWYTPDIHTATVDSCTTVAQKLVSQYNIHQCQVPVTRK